MLSEELTEVSAYSCTGNWTQEEETFTVSRAEAAGDYVLTRYLCDSHFNNCVTAKKCDGKSIEKTADVIRKVDETGVFKHYFVLEKDAFTLYRIEKQ